MESESETGKVPENVAEQALAVFKEFVEDMAASLKRHETMDHWPSARVRELARAIAVERGASAEDVYLWALNLYKVALEAEAEGNHLAIINAEDEIINDIIDLAPGTVAPQSTGG